MRSGERVTPTRPAQGQGRGAKTAPGIGGAHRGGQAEARGGRAEGDAAEPGSPPADAGPGGAPAAALARPSQGIPRPQPANAELRDRVFAFVQKRLRAGDPPTVREVQRALGFRGVETARRHLEALVAGGRLRVERGRARGYALPRPAAMRPEAPLAPPGEPAAPACWVPLLGRVQAGELTTAVEDPEGYLAVQTRRPAEALFALRVRGESMLGAGILPGDLVVVHSQPTARSGEIVVASVGDEATVKRLRLRGRRAELWPENPAFSPIEVDGETRILGVVIEVRRALS